MILDQPGLIYLCLELSDICRRQVQRVKRSRQQQGKPAPTANELSWGHEALKQRSNWVRDF